MAKLITYGIDGDTGKLVKRETELVSHPERMEKTGAARTRSRLHVDSADVGNGKVEYHDGWAPLAAAVRALDTRVKIAPDLARARELRVAKMRRRRILNRQ